MSQSKTILKLPLHKYLIDELQAMRSSVVALINDLVQQRVAHRKAYPRNHQGTLLGKARVQRESINKAIKSAIIDRDELDTQIWCKLNKVWEGLGMPIVSRKLGSVYATLRRVQVTSGVVLLSFEVHTKGTKHDLTQYLLTQDTFNPNKLP